MVSSRHSSDVVAKLRLAVQAELREEPQAALVLLLAVVLVLRPGSIPDLRGMAHCLGLRPSSRRPTSSVSAYRLRRCLPVAVLQPFHCPRYHCCFALWSLPQAPAERVQVLRAAFPCLELRVLPWAPPRVRR